MGLLLLDERQINAHEGLHLLVLLFLVIEVLEEDGLAPLDAAVLPIFHQLFMLFLNELEDLWELAFVLENELESPEGDLYEVEYLLLADIGRHAFEVDAHQVSHQFLLLAADIVEADVDEGREVGAAQHDADAVQE